MKRSLGRLATMMTGGGPGLALALVRAVSLAAGTSQVGCLVSTIIRRRDLRPGQEWVALALGRRGHGGRLPSGATRGCE
jgi:hypothetical protein